MGKNNNKFTSSIKSESKPVVKPEVKKEEVKPEVKVEPKIVESKDYFCSIYGKNCMKASCGSHDYKTCIWKQAK